MASKKVAYNIYCDESRYSNPFEQYFLIGAVILPRGDKSLIEKRLKAVKRKFGFMPELKWNNVTEAKLPYLNELLQVFFTSDIDFRAIVVDKSQLNKSRSGQIPEISFYKFYYLLLRGTLQSYTDYYVFLDQREKQSKGSIGELWRFLDNSLIKLHPADEKKDEPGKIAQIQEINSQESIFLQLLDVLMGAVGYYWNGFRGSPAKVKFVGNLTRWLEKPDLKFSSQLYDKKWNQFVWNPKNKA